MKKIFANIALALTLLGTATVADAQTYNTDQTVAYNNCRMYTLQGDDSYRSGSFSTAKFQYEQALQYNGDCPSRRYISDHELNRKIDNCVYAMNHGNRTREQVREDSQYSNYQYQAHRSEVSDAAAGAIVMGALACAVASAASHDAPHHHHFHHDHPHYNVFVYDGPHHHHHHHF